VNALIFILSLNFQSHAACVRKAKTEMKPLIKITVALLLYSAISCSPKFIVQTETPSSGDFGSYEAFKFYNPANMPASNFSFNEDDKKTIFDAIADEMKNRGYVSRQDAEIMIKVQGGTSSTSEIRNDNFGYPYNYNGYNYYGSRYYNNGMYPDYYNRPRDESKKETTIIIDIIDINTDKIVWQGVGIGQASKKESFSGQMLKDAITNIFLQYPHMAGK